MKMTKKDFEEYENQFNNARDKSAFFDRYYDPNVVFRHPYKGTFTGKSELVQFWNSGKNSGHDGIHEILHLKNFISVEGKTAVELDIEWRCFKDTDYLGPRKKGDVFWGKCAAFYEFTREKISHVQLYLNIAGEK
jgi:hypothetical protein